MQTKTFEFNIQLHTILIWNFTNNYKCLLTIGYLWHRNTASWKSVFFLTSAPNCSNPQKTSMLTRIFCGSRQRVISCLLRVKRSSGKLLVLKTETKYTVYRNCSDWSLYPVDQSESLSNMWKTSMSTCPDIPL